MAAMSSPTITFEVRVMGRTVAEAMEAVGRLLERVGRHDAALAAAIRPTGRAVVVSARHALAAVEVTMASADRDGAWVLLTSYGASPSRKLGAYWQGVEGVGHAPAEVLAGA